MGRFDLTLFLDRADLDETVFLDLNRPLFLVGVLVELAGTRRRFCVEVTCQWEAVSRYSSCSRLDRRERTDRDIQRTGWSKSCHLK